MLKFKKNLNSDTNDFETNNSDENRFVIKVLLITFGSIISMLLLFAIICAASATSYSSQSTVAAVESERMIVVENARNYTIYADKYTKVMYIVYETDYGAGSYHNGSISSLVLLDAEGKPLLYEGE